MSFLEPQPPVRVNEHGWAIYPNFHCYLTRYAPKAKPEDKDVILEVIGAASSTSMDEAHAEVLRQFTHYRRDRLDFYRWRYAKHLLDQALPGVRQRLKQPRWFRHSWQDEYPDQKPPKSLDDGRESIWFPERFINETYEAAWGDGETVLTVVAARFGWTLGQAYQATEDWFRDPVNYN
ncbi:hypothetical protein HOU02_gp362 [Caulobacter phage CcrBL9]|uniref:Uncharacterized protein n=1 Tax=Caulobacter phage CcrBL9 TaxID=2283270 RepID=A0A385EC59_9CAUD|nr:hypothetical protein HOU02_gp362 [Caulobacter phage CcrBL9]AXQ69363.1 hypothetical protein CcrBL9_gp339 [Caulobacter phage CcrBL9]